AGAEAIRDRSWDLLGAMMNQNQAIIAGLGGSGAEVDALVSACLESGAVGAKLAGAGLGGTVIALAEDLDGLEGALRERGYTRFMRPAISPGLAFEDAAENV